MTATNILHATDLRKEYRQGDDRLTILKGISLRIMAGETISIMGRSGCGKSTLVSLLAGLDEPSEGKIELLGRDLGRMSAGELNVFRARNVGVIFQQFHLLEHLTALENVRLPLDLARGGAGAEVGERDPARPGGAGEKRAAQDPDARAREMLTKVGLGHRLDHFPAQMSRGECQRVAIARVLVMNPQLVLADEPTGSLDAATGAEVIELIFRLAADSGFALILVTHDALVAARCQRHYFMEQGLLRERSETPGSAHTSGSPPAAAGASGVVG